MAECLKNTEARLHEEYPDKEMLEVINALPLTQVQAVSAAIKKQYDRPSNKNFSKEIETILLKDLPSVDRDRIAAFSTAYARILQEELVLAFPEVREKLQALAAWKSLETDSAEGRGEQIMGDKYEIHNSNVGFINSGILEGINKIHVNIENVEGPGDQDFSEAIQVLTEAVSQSTEISHEQQGEIIDQLEEISRQAALPVEKRSKPAVIKAVIASTAALLGTAANLAQIWSVWGDKIAKFFGF